MKYSGIFSEKGLSLERLRALVEVDEAGYIAAAAPDDENRQGLICRQLTELERFFHTDLKVRNGKTIRLSQAGRELAKLTRGYLNSLVEFKQSSAGLAGDITMAAGDSLLHWLILPRITQLRKALKGSVVHLQDRQNLRTCQLLQDHVIDFGLLRSDLAERGSLKGRALGSFGYSLFIPDSLCKRDSRATEAGLLQKLPIATQGGSTLFIRRLKQAIASKDWKLDMHLSSESFPQVAQCLATGQFAAILPDLARFTIASEKVWTLPLPSLRELRREIWLAWHPHHLETRPHIARAIDKLVETLTFAF